MLIDILFFKGGNIPKWKILSLIGDYNLNLMLNLLRFIPKIVKRIPDLVKTNLNKPRYLRNKNIIRPTKASVSVFVLTDLEIHKFNEYWDNIIKEDSLNVINSEFLIYSPNEDTMFEALVNSLHLLDTSIFTLSLLVLNILIIRFITNKLNNDYILTRLTKLTRNKFNIKLIFDNILIYNVKFYNFIIYWNIHFVFFILLVNYFVVWHIKFNLARLVTIHYINNNFEYLPSIDGKIKVELVNLNLSTELEYFINLLTY